MNKIYNIYFSPTGSSQRVAEIFSEKINAGEKLDIDLCNKNIDDIQIEKDSLCVISMPCYGGRIPETALERLLHIKAENSLAVALVTFGNRAYEDSLLELSRECEKLNFKVIAGGAVVTEHNIMHVYGKGRPDNNDKLEIEAFAEKVLEKLNKKDYSEPKFKGNYPYKEWKNNANPIEVDKEKCGQCGVCVEKCPVGAISKDSFEVNLSSCINCMRCIEVCSKKCRKIPDKLLNMITEKMKPVCESRKENEFFM